MTGCEVTGGGGSSQIACLQLVDQKVLSLDDASTIEKHLPESWTVPVLAGYDASDKPITHARRNPLTLRHLLSHTSGIGYPYNSPGIQRWIDENDIPNWFVCESGIKPLVLPLVYEPGTRWHFGLGIDWAGVLVSRASELVWTNTFSATSSARWLSQIAQCIQRMISDDIKREIQPICLMGPDGRFSPDKEEFKPRSWSPEALKSGLQSGGAGLFGTAKSYLRFLQGVLASRNGGGIISKASFDELFKSPLQQGEQGSQQRADMAVFAEDVALYDPAHLSNGTGSGLDFSTGLMINTVDSIHGRKAGAACGDGAARTQYWIDPGSGLVVSLGTKMAGSDT